MTQPNTVEQALKIAVGHHQAGRLAQAEELYRQILAQHPGNVNALHLLGMMACQVGRNEAAVELIGRALTLEPGSAQGHNNLGSALGGLKKYDEAIASFRQAVALRPDYAEAYNNLGNGLKETGQIGEAIAAYREAIALRPGYAESDSSLLCSLHFDAGFDPTAVAREHGRWNRQHAEPLKKLIEPWVNDRDPDRRIRIGYVSADLREHPVARFLLPLLERQDHGQFEVICYSGGASADAFTARIRSCADQWREIGGQTDEQAARQIRADGIDILVDLAGHTAGHRLLLFARKPAPVQVTYLGYPNTTGLTTIDYRVTDGLADPAGLTDGYHSEMVYRLARTGWCFAEPEGCSAVSSSPVARNGYVTFGSFNHFAKVTEPMMQAWARILHEVDGSRLLLKAEALGMAGVRQRVAATFMAQGIDAGRLLLRGRTGDYASHLAQYGEVDIALDTYPYHGTTTTCEALWMGVPVISMAGQSHLSRVGVSMLSNVGLTELIAKNTEEYVRVAVALGRDRERPAVLRSGLRERMRQSPLMDAATFARDIEGAYRQMWRRWCGQTAAL